MGQGEGFWEHCMGEIIMAKTINFVLMLRAVGLDIPFLWGFAPHAALG